MNPLPFKGQCWPKILVCISEIHCISLYSH
jgi:hypothetical protein